MTSSYPNPSIGPVTGQPGAPGPGSWPATVRATFTTGEEPSGSLVVTVASSDGITEVSVGAGSWLSVMALG